MEEKDVKVGNRYGCMNVYGSGSRMKYPNNLRIPPRMNACNDRNAERMRDTLEDNEPEKVSFNVSNVTSMYAMPGRKRNY